MANRKILTLSQKTARALPALLRERNETGNEDTPYNVPPGELWGCVASAAAKAGQANRYTYKMKIYTSPFLDVAKFVPTIASATTAAQVDAMNSTETFNTATVAGEYNCNVSATTCLEIKKIRPIRATTQLFKLFGPYRDPVDQKFYYAFTAKNDPWFGDEGG